MESQIHVLLFDDLAILGVCSNKMILGDLIKTDLSKPTELQEQTPATARSHGVAGANSSTSLSASLLQGLTVDLSSVVGCFCSKK